MRPVLLAPLLLLASAFAGCVVDEPADAPTTTSPVAGATPTTATPPGLAPSTCQSLLPDPAPRRGSGETVTLLTHDSFAMPEALEAAFEETSGYDLRLLPLGDAGEALSKAIVSKDAPLGDAFFGVDETLVLRARDAGLFAPYTSAAAVGLEARFTAPFCREGGLDVTPVSYGYVALNVDPAWFAEHGVAMPTDVAQLADAPYAPLTVVENPYTSSPGMAFLLATVSRFGGDATPELVAFWQDFVAHGGKVANGWEEAYGSDFTQGWDESGARDRPIVVSYTTSPAYNPMMGYTENATSANLDLPNASWRQTEAIGVLAGAKNPEGAKALVDFLLSRAFQDAVATTFVTYPVMEGASVPPEYERYAGEPEAPATLDARLVETKRDAWLEAWREATGAA